MLAAALEQKPALAQPPNVHAVAAIRGVGDVSEECAILQNRFNEHNSLDTDGLPVKLQA
jgi:hypothetical protein